MKNILILLRNLCLHFYRTLKKILYQKKNSRNHGLYFYEDFLLNLSKDRFTDKLIIKNGQYEQHLTFLFKKLIKEGDIVFDIGANIGVHSVLFSKLVGKNGKVFAFEPANKIADELRLNIALNRIDNIEVVEKVIGDEVKTYEFFQADPNSYDSGISSAIRTDVIKQFDSKKLINIKNILGDTIDNFCSSRNIIPTFIKIDIEGFEYFALKGGIEFFKKSKNLIIIFEHHSSRINSINLKNESFKNLMSEFNCYEIIKKDLYNPFVSIKKYNFDKDIKSEILCIKNSLI